VPPAGHHCGALKLAEIERGRLSCGSGSERGDEEKAAQIFSSRSRSRFY
jgi:hypothetical protein